MYRGESELFMLLIMIKYEYFTSLNPKVNFFCSKSLLGLPSQEFQVLMHRNFSMGTPASSALEEYYPYKRITMLIWEAKKFFEVYEEFKATTKFLTLQIQQSFNPADLVEAFRSNFSFN